MEITTLAKIDEYYKALLDRNSAYVGIFYVGVKTTSVFCIATCRARKPKKENVVFYNNYFDALKNGFRPCKICCPTENTHKTPDQVVQAIDLVKNNPKEKIKDFRLKEEGISPDFVRRWFKKTYGCTFHTFQRMYRINNAYKELKEGKSATKTAFDSGYESLSGFGYTFKKVLGKSPVNSKTQNLILISRIPTPLGPMFVCASEKGICLLEFTDRRMLETEFRDLQKLLNAQIIIGENEHTIQAKKEIEAYFKGERTHFNVALHTPGTDFQKQVWDALLKVPFGKTSTYKKQSIDINNPKAIRAVARANGFNRVAIIIPCHRIIAENGNLTGYAGGLERKEWLLNFENGIASKQIKLF